MNWSAEHLIIVALLVCLAVIASYYIYRHATRPRCSICRVVTDAIDEEGKPICETCSNKREVAEIEDIMDEEEELPCPRCNMMLEKQLCGNLVPVDGCPEQHGIWLDRGELQRLLEESRERGIADGIRMGYALRPGNIFERLLVGKWFRFK